MGMKIVFYCQHVLGVGHFFRSLEICRALAGHEVILVTGGPRFEVQLPGHISEPVSYTHLRAHETEAFEDLSLIHI